jgi:hypothetical protein
MNIQETQKPKTFAELEVQEEVSGVELVASLANYSDTGAAIDGLVVISIIERSELTQPELQVLQAAAVRGITEQARNRFRSSPESVSMEQGHYAKVLGVVGLKLELIDEPE